MSVGWVEVYIGLGSNLEQPEAQLREAVGSLVSDRDFRCIATSPVYRSEPLTQSGQRGEQPRYLNAVLRAETALSAPKLLRRLQEQEQAQGRRRLVRWGARTLDLDILLYGDEEIDQPGLQVPHYALAERLFVVKPLADLTPALSVPGHGNIVDLLQQLRDEPALEATDIQLIP